MEPPPPPQTHFFVCFLNIRSPFGDTGVPENTVWETIAIAHYFSVDELHQGLLKKGPFGVPLETCSAPGKGPGIYILISFWR